MDFDIRPLDRDLATLEAMERVGLACFGSGYVEESRLTRKWASGGDGTIFLGAFEGERLAGYIGFIPYDGWLGEQPKIVFQAIQGGTDPEFRGRGVFSKIASRAMELLPGDYMIGYPNDQALPVWRERMRFHIVPQVRLWFPCRIALPLIDVEALESGFGDGGLCRVDQRSAARVKKDEGHATLEHEAAGNYVWGRVRSRSLGPVNLKFFDGGGCDIREPRGFGELLRSLGKAAGVSAVRFVCTRSSPLAKGARFSLPLKNSMFIWQSLRPNCGCTAFEAFSGVADFW
jgi:hypothetical protein